MRRFIILGLLALMPASLAGAQPPAPSPERRPVHVYERDRYDEGHYDREGRRRDGWNARRWVPLAEGVAASSVRQFINVGHHGRDRFSRLLIEGVRGAPVIERIAVEFADRRTQVWDLNTRLRRGADEVIDLGFPQRIRRVVVYTNPAYRGAYSIYAMAPRFMPVR